MVIDNIVGSKNLQILEKSLDAASLRHTVIANNLANVDTPGFKATKVLFEDQLKKALDRNQLIAGKLTRPGHIPFENFDYRQVTPKAIEDKTTVMRNDGNNVDIDAEMAILAKNTLYYNTLAQQIAGKFSTLKNVIKEGGR